MLSDWRTFQLRFVFWLNQIVYIICLYKKCFPSAFFVSKHTLSIHQNSTCKRAFVVFLFFFIITLWKTRVNMKNKWKINECNAIITCDSLNDFCLYGFVYTAMYSAHDTTIIHIFTSWIHIMNWKWKKQKTKSIWCQFILWNIIK